MSGGIFLTHRIPDKAVALLRSKGTVDMIGAGEADLTVEELTRGVARNAYLYCLICDPITTGVVQANPDLKVIASMSIDAAHIDVKEATALRIPVTTIPPIVTEATADMVWTLILAVARNLLPGDRSLRAGNFHGVQTAFFVGRAVYEKTLGVIGLGRIGEAVARRAAGFRMNILYSDVHRLPPEKEQALGLRYVSMEALLQDSDYVTLHPNLTPDTHHLIGPKELRMMKSSAYLINASRGAVVDEQALLEALRNGEIAGAALDVYENEPHVMPGLAELDTVVLSPHLGSAVDEVREEMALIVARNLIAVMEGRRPPNIFNPEIYA